MSNHIDDSGLPPTIDKKSGRVSSRGKRAIAGLGALLAAILAVLANLTSIIDFLTKTHNKPKEIISSVPGQTSCYRVKLLYQQKVYVSQWRSMKLNLNVENICQEEPYAYVRLAVSAGGRIEIDPPYVDDPSCDPKWQQPLCWDEAQLRRGTSSLELSPPRLRPLQNRLGGRLQVALKWLVIKETDRATLGLDKAEFWLDDDPPAMATSHGSALRVGRAADREAPSRPPGGLTARLAVLLHFGRLLEARPRPSVPLVWDSIPAPFSKRSDLGDRRPTSSFN